MEKTDYITWEDISSPDQTPQQSEPQSFPWDNQPQETEPQQPPTQEQPQNIDEKYSMLGRFPKLSIDTDAYLLGFDENALIGELASTTPKATNEKGKFLIDFSQGANLQNLTTTLNQIASNNYNAKLDNCFVYKLNNGESLSNITSNKSSYSFIYYLQANSSNSKVLLDLSSISGPTIPQSDPATGILNIFPGWVPYSLSNNTSSQELIAIAGTFNE